MRATAGTSSGLLTQIVLLDSKASWVIWVQPPWPICSNQDQLTEKESNKKSFVAVIAVIGNMSKLSDWLHKVVWPVSIQTTGTVSRPSPTLGGTLGEILFAQNMCWRPLLGTKTHTKYVPKCVPWCQTSAKVMSWKPNHTLSAHLVGGPH